MAGFLASSFLLLANLRLHFIRQLVVVRLGIRSCGRCRIGLHLLLGDKLLLLVPIRLKRGLLLGKRLLELLRLGNHTLLMLGRLVGIAHARHKAVEAIGVEQQAEEIEGTALVLVGGKDAELLLEFGELRLLLFYLGFGLNDALFGGLEIGLDAMQVIAGLLCLRIQLVQLLRRGIELLLELGRGNTVCIHGHAGEAESQDHGEGGCRNGNVAAFKVCHLVQTSPNVSAPHAPRRAWDTSGSHERTLDVASF